MLEKFRANVLKLSCKLWNELPSDIRDLNSINIFKTAIKTYLFRQAFL